MNIELAALLDRFKVLYPYGIPLRKGVKLGFVVDSIESLTQEERQLLQDVIIKGLKLSETECELISFNDIKSAKAPLLILLGLKSISWQDRWGIIENKPSIQTVSLKDSLSSIELKKQFWNDLKEVLARM